jgi:outer membrane protein assembly factor BamD
MTRGTLVVLALAMLAAAGCGGTIKETGVSGVASYERGREEFDRKEYMDAIADLKAYVEQFPGTENTDDALFYLGESYFRIKDYALASGQYDRLIRDFPASPYQPDALVQLAHCDDLQSHSAPLDQTETLRAISRYKSFLELYPEHARAKDARARLEALSDRQAEKRWRNGRLYTRLKSYDAAVFYFESVMKDYPDSRWAAESALLVSDIYTRRHHWEEAIEALSRVDQVANAPAGLKKEAQRRLREVQSKAGAKP